MHNRGDASHYDILGVRQDASQREITQAFRAQARELHPDRFAGVPEPERHAAEAGFKRLSEAYEVLRDDDRRRAYDTQLAGVAPRREIEIAPLTATARSAAGAFSVQAAMRVSGGAGSDLHLDVSCDDPDIELTGMDVRPGSTHEELSLVVRGRVINGGSRTIWLVYSAGAEAAAQRVEIMVKAPALRGLMRRVSFTRFGGFWGWWPYAVIVIGLMAATAGLATYLLGNRNFSLFALSAGAAMTIVGLVLLARDWVIMRFALEGWGRWIVIGITIIGLRVGLILARQLF